MLPLPPLERDRRQTPLVWRFKRYQTQPVLAPGARGNVPIAGHGCGCVRMQLTCSGALHILCHGQADIARRFQTSSPVGRSVRESSRASVICAIVAATDIANGTD